jgi:hypothetical protein
MTSLLRLLRRLGTAMLLLGLGVLYVVGHAEDEEPDGGTIVEVEQD